MIKQDTLSTLFTQSQVKARVNSKFMGMFAEFIINSCSFKRFGPYFSYGEATVTTRYMSESGHVLEFRCFFNDIDGTTHDFFQFEINDVADSAKYYGTIRELGEYGNYFERLMTLTGIPLPRMYHGTMITPKEVTEEKVVAAETPMITPTDTTLLQTVTEEKVVTTAAAVNVQPQVELNPTEPVLVIPTVALAVTREAVYLLRMWMEETNPSSVEFNSTNGYCAFEIEGFGIGVEIARADGDTTVSITYETQTYQYTKEEMNAVHVAVWDMLEKFVDFAKLGL